MIGNFLFFFSQRGWKLLHRNILNLKIVSWNYYNMTLRVLTCSEARKIFIFQQFHEIITRLHRASNESYFNFICSNNKSFSSFFLFVLIILQCILNLSANYSSLQIAHVSFSRSKRISLNYYLTQRFLRHYNYNSVLFYFPIFSRVYCYPEG